MIVPGDIADETERLKGAARRLGFELAGVAPAVTPGGLHEFLGWLERGYAGQMDYLPRRAHAYEHPRHVLDGARSVVMLGMNYNTRAPPGPRRGGPPGGDAPCPGEFRHGGPAPRVARYAQGGVDYHDLIRDRLRRLGEFLAARIPGARTRGVVDTAPLLERDFARLAGLGWFGKNTMLINKRRGSWFFLAALLTDLELAYDAPHEASHCGTCTRCLDACPTGAFPAPYVLDARKCISYLTIERRGPLADEERSAIGEWLFGCDICQEVCPWNGKAPVTSEPAFQPRPDLDPPDAAALLSLSAAECNDRFAGTALERPRRAGLLRNAAIVLGNLGDARGGPALVAALTDPDPVVRDAAAWGLARLDAAARGSSAVNGNAPREAPV